MAESVTRSVSIDLFVPDEQRQSVLNSVRHYRLCCRDVYAALLLAQTAGAEIEDIEGAMRLKPQSDQAKLALAAALGVARITPGDREKGNGQSFTVNVGSAMAYECRAWVLQQLFPTAMSFVWDSLRRDVVTVWTSRDPEHTQATRGWLALQGARGVAQFQRRGIGFPTATARPKLAGNTLTLKWDRELGAVEFRIPRLDGGRYYVWRALRDGDEGWKLGTVYLGERDGKLYAVLSHDRPAQAASVDAERVCTVRFGDTQEGFLRIVGPDGAQTYDSISAESAVAAMERLRVHRDKQEKRRAACGNPRRPWGHRKGWLANQDVLTRCTLQRDRLQKDVNHCWSRWAVSRAVSWRCGKLVVEAMPADLFGHSWSWATQFRMFLAYKAEEVGIELVLGKP